MEAEKNSPWTIPPRLAWRSRSGKGRRYTARHHCRNSRSVFVSSQWLTSQWRRKHIRSDHLCPQLCAWHGGDGAMWKAAWKKLRLSKYQSERLRGCLQKSP